MPHLSARAVKLSRSSLITLITVIAALSPPEPCAQPLNKEPLPSLCEPVP